MKRIVLAFAALALSTTALAEAGAGVRIGTNGLGVDVAYAFNDSLSARVGYSYANFGFSYNDTDVEYDSTLKLSNLSLLLDWNVVGGFRISAGLVPQKNKIEITGKPTGGSYTLNGVTYSASDITDLSGKIESGNSVAPYLGIGYGIVAGRGVNFYADLGLQYQGSPKVGLSASCGPSLNASACAGLQGNVAAEQAKLADDIKNFKWYPVLSIGLTVGF